MKPLAAAASAFLLLAAVASAAPGDDMYARPGKLVAASGTRLNLYCTGSGSPAVVFDSGWEDWAPVWTIVQPEVAKLTRACSYDRAGAGFSDHRGDLKRIAELREFISEMEQMPADEAYLQQSFPGLTPDARALDRLPWCPHIRSGAHADTGTTACPRFARVGVGVR